MKTKTFAISIVFTNQETITLNCLKSITINSDLRDIKIYLVDNDSEPEVQKKITNYLDDYKIDYFYTKNKKNVGWLKAVNHNFRLAKQRYFVAMNNDVVVGTDWLGIMKRALDEDKELWQVGPLGRIQNMTGGGAFGIRGNTIYRDVYPDYIEGWMFMVRAGQIKLRFGDLFDERNLFIGYGDDSDLSLRIREIGKRIAVVNLPNTLHLGNASFSKPPSFDPSDYRERNHEYGKKRWGKYWTTRFLEIKK